MMPRTIWDKDSMGPRNIVMLIIILVFPWQLHCPVAFVKPWLTRWCNHIGNNQTRNTRGVSSMIGSFPILSQSIFMRFSQPTLNNPLETTMDIRRSGLKQITRWLWPLDGISFGGCQSDMQVAIQIQLIWRKSHWYCLLVSRLSMQDSNEVAKAPTWIQEQVVKRRKEM
ncbi:hypothetical protein Nepgr_009831 [Nepenthes gracilis]|uniref:Uncharacterized protein n=1 Tax=Nepenthes gracilis TaxID=150966 RepID=A0AAD3SBV6_NEPGR|nr:hypothetical protein Nepgr_009831 [Nepenthes gracilis]